MDRGPVKYTEMEMLETWKENVIGMYFLKKYRSVSGRAGINKMRYIQSSKKCECVNCARKKQHDCHRLTKYRLYTTGAAITIERNT